MKGQLEELGEETDENVENISKMQGQILNMTGGKVNIFDDLGNFKSTYEIMKGIAEVWDDLSSIDQANLLETIAGKHRANDVAALLSNWENVEAAVKSASEAEGSAARENQKYVDSLQGRLDKLTTAWQSFANTFMESDFLKGAVSGLTGLVEIIEKLVKTLGTTGTIGLGAGIFGLFKHRGGILESFSNFGSLASEIMGSSQKLGDKFKYLGKTASATGGKITKELTSSLAGTVGAIGLAVAAVGLIINAYKNYKEEQSRLRQETIRTSDEFLEAAGSFEQAYIKYSGRTDLTSEEEAELETAIKGTVDALGDKSSALQDVVNSSDSYIKSLEQISRKEREAANEAAKEKRKAAEKELEEAAIGWEKTDGSEVNISTHDNEAVKILKDIGKEYYTLEENARGDTRFNGLKLDADSNVEEIIEYYYTLLDIKKELEEADLEDTADYDNVTSAIERMSEAVNVYTDGVYEAEKAQYQLAYGYPTTTEAYLKMRESILSGMGDMSFDTRKSIADSLDSEYSQMFDLSSSNAQSRKLIGVLDEYGDKEAYQMETFLNMRTKVNNRECTVGEYVSQFNDIEDMTKDWDDKSKEELNSSFGLDTDAIKEQYDKVYDYLSNKDISALNEYEFTPEFRIEKDNIKDQEIKNFLDGLSTSELAAVVNLKTELDWENDSWDDILSQIEEEAKLIEAISFSVNLELETEKLENLTTAVTESISGAGLGDTSISLVKDMFGDLDDYDQSSLFERTAHGIRLNSDELRKLNDEYKQTNVDGLNNKIDALGERYNQTKEELYSLTYGTDEYNDKARELSDIEAQINATETLAAQYAGLTSAYQEWQRTESAGSQRDMYESMIEGFETVGDEISRGWLDDGTIEFLELIKGEKATIVDGNGVAKEINIATASAKDLKQVWKDLDKNIKHTSYSVRDFFTVDEDGNSTSKGVYNFLDAIGQMEEEKFGGKDVVKRNKKGEIIAFDFQIAGGDKAIAEALGISEELVQIMKRAADDAGFVVSMDGTYQQLDVLKEKAQEAANKLKDTFKKTEFTFDLNTNSETSIVDQYNEAYKIWEQFKKNKKSDGTIDMSVKGAEEAYTLVSTLQSMVDKLNEPVYMELNATQVEKDMQTPLSKLQEYETLTQTEHQLKLKGTDTSEIEKSKEEIVNYFDELQENKPEIAAELGIEGLTREEIQAKVEAGEIEIPATIDLQVEMNDTLKDMVNVALYNAGLIDKEELEKRVDIKLYAGKIDTSDVEKDTEDAVENSDTDIERKQNIEIIAETFGVENVEALSTKLEGLDDKTIQAIAEVLGQVDVDKLKNTFAKLDTKKVEAIAKAIGEGDVKGLKTAINQLSPKQVQAIAEALGYSDVNELNAAIDGMDGNTVQAVAQALGLGDVNTLQITINNMHGNTVDAKVNTEGQASKISTLQEKINSLKGKVVDVVVNTIKTIASGGKKKAAQRTGADPAGNDSEVNGTAHIGGTAFKQGDWRTKKTERALTGELGREIVVTPQNRWYTVGDNGAEFVNIPRGSIVFNHKQTEELLKNGKATSDGGRARALVNGTAFLGGTAHRGEGQWIGVDKPSFKVGYDYSASSSNSDSKKSQEIFDWIEVAISRIEREIDNLDTKANSVYRSWTERNTALVSEINTVGNEIALQKNAISGYQQALNEIGLNQDYINKIKSGTIDIDNITDETLAEKVKDYQKWFEKILECEDAILELTEKENDLIQQKFDNIIDRYDGYLSVIEHEKNMLDEYISQSEAQGHLVSEKYYDALANNERENIAMLQQEKDELLARLGDQERGTQQWYDNVAAIDEVTEAIEAGNTALLEYAQAIQEIKFEQFDLLQDRISAVTEEADFLIELLSSDKLYEDNSQLTDSGLSTMGLHAQSYNVFMHQADMVAEEIKRLKKEMENDPLDVESLEARYREMVSLQQEYILSAQDAKEAIRDMVEEGIEYELDALDELISKYTDALNSQKDLNDYEKDVSKQVENISSLRKQLSSIDNDDSEEGRIRKQQLSTELKEAEEELESTELDRLIENTERILDDLYLEYEQTLNSRMDNLDVLIMDMIAEINANAGTISSTLTETADSVGYTLSDAMKTTWDTSTTTITGGQNAIKDVVTNYGEHFKQTQTNTKIALDAIKLNTANMISKLDSIANKKTVSAAKSSAATPKKTSGSSSTATKKPTTINKNTSSGGDGVPKIGDKVKFVSGQYYYDSQGKKPLGSYYRGKEVYITNINKKDWATHGYHISTGNKLGKGDLGWLKLNQLSGYASGKKNFLNDELGWTQENGKEFIVRPSDGAILTPIAKRDSILNAQASNNIWDMANSPAEFIKDNLNLGSTNMPNNSGTHSVYNQTIENVTFRMDNVKNYDEILTSLSKDKNFDRLVEAMTLGKLAGKSSLAKGKAIR